MEKESKPHEPWCAKSIAFNAQLPWAVRCDCKPKERKTRIRRGQLELLPQPNN